MKAIYVVDTAMSSLVNTTTKNNAQLNYLTGEQNQSVKKLNIITGLKPWDSPGRPTTSKTSTSSSGTASYDAIDLKKKWDKKKPERKLPQEFFNKVVYLFKCIAYVFHRVSVGNTNKSFTACTECITGNNRNLLVL